MSRSDGGKAARPKPNQTLPEEMRWPQSRRKLLVELNYEAMRYWHRNLKATPHAMEYLASRGFSDPESLASKYQIGYAPAPGEGRSFVHHILERGMDGATNREDLENALVAAGLAKRRENGKIGEFFWDGRLVFPITDRGTLDLLAHRGSNVVGFGGRYVPSPDGSREKDPDREPPKWLNTSETAVFKKRSVLYGWAWAAGHVTATRECIILEGYLDVIQVREAGFENVVATLGTSLTEGHIARFPAPIQTKTLRVILSTDDDPAGHKSAMRSSALIFTERPDVQVRIARPLDGLDPDDLVRLRGAEAFRDVLDQALSPAQRYLADRSLAGAPSRLAPLVSVIREVGSFLSPSPQDRLADLEYLQGWLADAFDVHLPVSVLKDVLSDSVAE